MRRGLALALASLCLISCGSWFTSGGDTVATELKTDAGVIVGHVSFTRGHAFVDYVVMRGYVSGLDPHSDHGVTLTIENLIGACKDDHLSYSNSTQHGPPGQSGSHEGDLGNGKADADGVIWFMDQHVDWLYEHFDDLNDCCFVVYKEPDSATPVNNGGLVHVYAKGHPR